MGPSFEPMQIPSPGGTTSEPEPQQIPVEPNDVQVPGSPVQTAPVPSNGYTTPVREGGRERSRSPYAHLTEESNANTAYLAQLTGWRPKSKKAKNYQPKFTVVKDFKIV